MKTFATWMLLAVLGFGLTGCVAQSNLDQMRDAYRKTQEQVVSLRQQLENARTQIATLRQQQDQNPDAALQARLDKARADRDRLEAQLKKTMALLEQARGMQQLPRQLSNQLAQLADANPNLMSYDPDRGMVRLRSDLTFALGSTKVNPKAKSTLDRLASVLKSSPAQPYEVRVVGHTDNVPVKNPANKKKYGDNWGLSAFRAIAVKDVLQSAGITPGRMSIAGYGQYQPVASNGPHGSEANRRVEIFLVQPYQSGEAGAATSNAPASSSPSSSSNANSNGGGAQEMSQPESSKEAPAAFK